MSKGVVIMAQFSNFRPRRDIEKSRSIIYTSPVTQAVISKILHTCDDAETLIRTIVDLAAVHILATVDRFAWTIQHVPKGGTPITTPTTVESLDASQSTVQILAGNVMSKIDGELIRFQVDSAGMRKLKKHDTISLCTTALADVSYELHGSVILFFKE